MNLLLGSGGFRTEERVANLARHMRAHFGDVDRLLFIPYALADHDAYVGMMVQRGIHAGYRLDGIHHYDDPARAVAEAPAIFVGGGNTFRLVHDLYRFGLIEVIRQRVRAGVPYLGISAGTNVACPTLMTTNDMPIVAPPSFETLDLVPFQINPHYFNGQVHVQEGERLVPHFGETRDDRIREYHEMNDRPVLGLWEGGILHVSDDDVTLHCAPARVFRRGHQPLDVEPVASLREWLAPPAS
ncbi:MAG: dipeptidase PepE [Phycisphaerales bacterium]|nr:MAG: dipeptidase PepE [Phycisphaerales bacterium]